MIVHRSFTITVKCCIILTSLLKIQVLLTLSRVIWDGSTLLMEETW